MVALLVVWAVVGLGCGVLFADALAPYSIGGFPLGFWFAQQGSILVFVLLILVYAVSLNRLDRVYRDRLGALDREGDSGRDSGGDGGGDPTGDGAGDGRGAA